jgi:hypothetical protein
MTFFICFYILLRVLGLKWTEIFSHLFFEPSAYLVFINTGSGNGNGNGDSASDGASTGTEEFSSSNSGSEDEEETEYQKKTPKEKRSYINDVK